MAGIHLLTDEKIEKATKSICDGGNLWLKVKRAKDGRLWKSWAFLYASADGRRREMGLGSLKAVTVDQARANAAQAHKWLEDMPPKDPITERRGEREKIATIVGVTVNDVIADYIKNVLPGHSEDGQNYIRAQLKRIGKGVGRFAPKDVTPKMLCDYTGYGDLYLTQFPTSTKLLIVMKELFGRAKAAGLCPTNPTEDIKYARPRRAKKHKVQRHPSVPREDMHAFITAVRDHQDGRTKKPGRMNSTYACEMIALTGVRVSEVIEATWSEIDTINKRWTVPWQHLKIKDAEIDRPIPITSSMAAILQVMKDCCGDKIGSDDPVFRSPSRKRRHFYTDAAIGDVAERVGWPEKIHNHGFRTTLQGWGNNQPQQPHYPHLVKI